MRGRRTATVLALPLSLVVVALAVAGAGAADPRIPLVERQVERDHQAALRAVDQILADDPETARRLGLDYLRGHLLLTLDRRREALQAFATSMGATPALQCYSRYRLALEQEAMGHPEVAAGLVAKLLEANPPRTLVGPAMRLLQRTLAQGGDCRVLGKLNRRRFGNRDRRRLTLAHAECAARRGETARSQQILRQLLEEDRRDDVARVAALGIARAKPQEKDPRTHLLVGLSFYNHRDFTPAIHHLAWALVRLQTATDISTREAFECRYALARSHFWQERFKAAAGAFANLAKTTQSPTRKAQAIYQQARSLELDGNWEQATVAFDRAYQLDPSGRWSDSALISRLRLQWPAGSTTEALDASEILIAKRRYDTAVRALLFLASSELVQGRSERAAGWLSRAAQLGRKPRQEVDYWSGRLEEIRQDPGKAVRHYLAALRRDPYHPNGAAALARLASEPLAPVARATALRLVGSSDLGELYSAWLLLGDSHIQGRRARHRIEQRLAADQAVAPYLRLAMEPTADWPLWQAPLRRPEEMLLALGIFEEGASVVLRHFPVAQPGLAFTGSVVLAQSGEIKRSLYIAEILAKRIRGRVPTQFLPTSYRRLLFPFGYSYLILRESAERDVDPYLLAAIIREESRFDPRAFSGASARGLAQFVLPTARRVAAVAGLDPVTPFDLEKPEVSIALGAAYLRQLADEFAGATPQMVAAYNAGEPQARLWRRYCVSDEPEEFLAKVGFRETRAYLNRVLSSRAHYLELYAPPAEDPADGMSEPRATASVPGRR